MRTRITLTIPLERAFQQALGIVLVVCCLLQPGGVAGAGQEPEAQDVSGTWALELMLPEGDVFTGTLTLHQEDGQVSGIWRREGANDEPRVRGKIEGKAITFYWYMNIPARGDGSDAAVKMSFDGEIEDDSMTGTASFGSRAEDLAWTAKRTN